MVERRRHRVLVVDDHPDSAEMICMMLRLLGHDSRAAVGGELGLAAALDMQPDIALLDIGMPDLSGYALARRLRSELGHALYLAAITGWGEPRDRERAFDAGFDRHVVKPASKVLIQDIIRTAACRLDAIADC